MWRPPVHDVSAFDSVGHSVHATSDFGNHARRNRAAGDQLFGFISRELRDEARLVGKIAVNARDIGEEHELRGFDFLRDGGGGEVGVDVERFAVSALRNRRDHWHEAAALQRFDDASIHAFDLADQAPIVFALELGCPKQAAIFARQADGGRAFIAQVSRDVLADLTQHHFRHAHRFLIGDAHPVNEVRLDAHPFAHLGNLRATAVNHDRANANVVQEGDVAHDGGLQFGRSLRRAPVFDDDGLPVQIADEGQRLGDDARVFGGDGKFGWHEKHKRRARARLFEMFFILSPLPYQHIDEGKTTHHFAEIHSSKSRTALPDDIAEHPETRNIGGQREQVPPAR